MTSKPAEPKRRISREILSVAMAVGITLVARSSLADQYHIPSESMMPSVHIADRVLVAKAQYGLRVPWTETYLVRFGDPARGDVVVLDSPESDMVLLKRVVAVPGDRVRVTDGALEINGVRVPMEANGHELREVLGGREHAVSLDDGGGPDFGPTVMPDGRFLVMGDNRGNSRDGRFFGLVSRSAILGRARGIFLRDGAPTWRPL